MSISYIPSREAEMDNWLSNFKTLIAATPTSYGLVSADATSITSAYTAWHSAYQTAINPTTRTKATVQAKNQQKANVLIVCRGYAATIRDNAAVTDLLKIGLGLHIHDAAPTPVPAPVTAPRLSFAAMRPGQQDLIAADEATPGKRAKPVGAAGLLLFRAIGTGATPPASDCAFLSFVTRSAYTSTFDAADNGKTATYFARWTNAKGEVGPWSVPLSMPIAA